MLGIYVEPEEIDDRCAST